MVGGTRIGEAAALLGTEAHVLRHWEDMALLQPRRSTSGHRIFDQEQLTRARLIQVCQRAGLSLGEIRALGMSDTPGRMRLIAEKQAELAQAAHRLERGAAFLEHLLTCRHPIASECEDCVDFAKGDRAVRGGVPRLVG